MFRVSQHPSSGVLKTVTAASGTGHNTGLSMLFITDRLQAYFLNIRQMASVYINALLQTCLEVAVHAPPYVLINSRNFVNNGLFEFLNSHDTPPEHTVFQEPSQEKNLVQ